MSRYDSTSAPENAIGKVGQHKWQSCEEHARRVYTDNRVGVVWKIGAKAREYDSRGIRASGMVVEPERYVCDKCAKSFKTPDDPEIYIESESHENKPGPEQWFKEGPRPGGPIFSIEGERIATTLIVLGKIENSIVKMLYEIVPKVNPGVRSPGMTAYVRRVKITIKKSFETATREFKKVQDAYVFCSRTPPYDPVAGMSREGPP